MSPVPVENDLPRISSRDYVAGSGKRFVARRGNGDAPGFDLRPAGTWEAIFGRVNGVARALASKIRDEQIYGGGLLRIPIKAVEKVAGPEYFECLLIDGNVSARPRSQLRGKLFQKETRRKNFAATSSLEEGGRGDDKQRGSPCLSGNTSRTIACRA